MDNAIYGSAKAWVNWIGSSGTINASYNVSSVTRASTGTYTVNFTNAFADTKYVLSGFAEWQTGVSGNAGIAYGGDSAKLAGSCKVGCFNYTTGAAYDPVSVGIAVFR